MPFFFDLSSLIPTVERNPFEPILVPDVIQEEIVPEETEALDIIDTGLPIPAHYDFDLMRAMVQDPFRLFVYWQIKDDPFERLRKIFPKGQVEEFHTVVKLIDETNNIAVFFNAAFSREYWFSVFPDRSYRVEMGLRSDRNGFVRLLSSQSVTTPRGGPSDQVAPEPEYRITADEYIEVVRQSHLVPERAFTLDGLLPGAGDVPAEARNAVWESLPPSFRRLMTAIVDIQAGRDFDKWWEHLSQAELSGVVSEFLGIIRQMGDGELGYILLLRYLPELLRRAIRAEHATDLEREIQIDKPILLYLAERLGQAASEMQPPKALENQGGGPGKEGPSPLEVSQGQWLPSMKS